MASRPPLYEPFDVDEDVDDEEPTSEAATEEEVQDFKNQVAEWVKLDDQIKKLRDALKERRVHQRALGTRVQEFMKRNGYDNLNTQNCVIKSTIREAPTPIKLVEIRTQLFALENETLPIKEVIERLFFAERPKVTKQSLRRVVQKASMDI